MLLTITSTTPPATDLGFLLHKRPDRAQSFELPFGRAHVFYPEASESRCTAALLLDVNPIDLARRRQDAPRDGAPLEPYVNDRPYVASSFLSVAISRVYGSALSGASKERAELAQTAIPLEARLAVAPVRGGEDVLRSLFEPLGYEVVAEGFPLDERFPEWGASPYFIVTLRATKRLSELLTHLYVLIPVLDAEKHYWVGEDEVEKLLRHGGDWLAAHPARELIVNRYLKRKRSLTRQALERLVQEDEADPDETEASQDAEEATVEAPLSLTRQRLEAVMAAIKASGARRVLDLGCGEGRLLRELLADKSFETIVGVDVSTRALELAERRLRLDRLREADQKRITLRQGALTYRDRSLAGFDAAALVEVVEHLEPSRLPAFERVVFGQARPRMVVLTTPNVEYNARFQAMPVGRLRHRDHRFEWTRAEFQTWAQGVASQYGYAVRLEPIGPVDEALGPPTQMAIFTLEDAEA